MATSQGIKTPIEPGLIARVVSGVRYMITGRADDFFGPGQPLAPTSQVSAGRQFDYPTGFNTRVTPRAEECVTFAQMRSLADNYDLLRLVIETRKDQMCIMPWAVKPIDDEAESDSRCDDLTKFLKSPDQEHTWQQWLRMLLEDLYVIDAACIYPRPNKGGGLYSLELVDGALIKRVIDQTGRTPMPPDPAYQQIIKGLPAVDYTREELIYSPRNPRTNRLYGYSPVEQIIMTVNIAMRRQLFQLSYYTEGNVPDALISTPETWNPDQIRQFQNWFDSLLEGNLAQRRKAKFIPFGVEYHDTKQGVIGDKYDEWLARVICFAFSVAPTPFIAQNNRATAQTAQQTALSEGLMPTMEWVKSILDVVIQQRFGYDDLQFMWSEPDVTDAATQAEIDVAYVGAKVKTADEVRDDLGLEPLTDDQKEELNPTPPGQVDENGNPLPPLQAKQLPAPKVTGGAAAAKRLREFKKKSRTYS